VEDYDRRWTRGLRGGGCKNGEPGQARIARGDQVCSTRPPPNPLTKGGKCEATARLVDPRSRSEEGEGREQGELRADDQVWRFPEDLAPSPSGTDISKRTTKRAGRVLYEGQNRPKCRAVNPCRENARR